MVQRLEWSACDAHGCHCDIIESKDGDMVNYEDYAALKALTDKLVKLRRGGTVTPEVMCAINKLVDEYKYDN